MCTFVTGADSSYVTIILGVLFAVFFIGFIIAVIYIIYIRRKQGALTRRFTTILQVLCETHCSVFVIDLNIRFYLCDIIIVMYLWTCVSMCDMRQRVVLTMWLTILIISVTLTDKRLQNINTTTTTSTTHRMSTKKRLIKSSMSTDNHQSSINSWDDDKDLEKSYWTTHWAIAQLLLLYWA